MHIPTLYMSERLVRYTQGSNAYGQVGDGTISTRTTPSLVSYEGSWLQVATGDYHACGIRSDFSAWCWVRMAGCGGVLGGSRVAPRCGMSAAAGMYAERKRPTSPGLQFRDTTTRVSSETAR